MNNSIPRLFLIFLLISIGFIATKAQTNPSQPNILLIIGDDIGVDAANGYQDSPILPNTPNLDALRSSGLTFMNAWAAPKCAPTRANIMSGKYGVKTGVVDVPGNLATTHTSIFKELESITNSAYANALIGKWHLSGPSTDYTIPGQHGIAHYEGSFTGGVSDYYNWLKVSNETASMETTYATTYYTDKAIDWIGSQNQPWFLWLAHNSAHTPFHIPPSDLYTSTNTNDNQGKYIAMIEAMDAEIGRLLNNISADVLANTTIIYIGDNGTPNGVLQNYPDRQGKGSLYQGGVHVPMTVSGVGVTRQNEEESAMVHATDIYATILELTGTELSGGIHNSLSFKHLLDNSDGAKRPYNYSESANDWTLRNVQYKLIQLADGTQEFYDLLADPLEENNLINNLTAEQTTIKTELETEGAQIRSGWSCNDFILNGDEVTVDDCMSSVTPSECENDNSTSYTNIGCCSIQEHPNAYFETVEGDTRTIYSNNYPNHSFCFNNRIPEPVYGIYELDAVPQKAAAITTVVRENGRPRMHFGVAVNGVAFAPAPALPFIFENPNTGEFNWDWVFEPTNNQGEGRDKVALDCASAHTSASGYHYHGNMFEYVETIQPGISSATDSPSSLLHIGWAADGFPILYRFGPDGSGGLSLLQPSYQLKAGDRPGDGITEPCGPYNGKYTKDYEYNAEIGDLDECNGIDRSVTISTANGEETFPYFYVITDSFPQVPRCVVGTPAAVFIDGDQNLTFIDNDNDGYIAEIDCDDNNAAIFPNAEDIPNNGIDEDCDGADAIISNVEDLAHFGLTIYPNPVSDLLVLNFKDDLKSGLTISLFNNSGQLILSKQIEKGAAIHSLDVTTIAKGAYILQLDDGVSIGRQKVVVIQP